MNRHFSPLVVLAPIAACLWAAACGSVSPIPADNGARSGTTGATSGGSGTSENSGSSGGESGTTGRGGASGTSGRSGARSGSVEGGVDVGTPAEAGPSGSEDAADGSETQVPGTLYGLQSTVVTPERVATTYATWKERYLVSCAGDGGAVAMRVQIGSVTEPSPDGQSESTGYGMLLAVAADQRADFDGMWTWYQHRTNKNGLMGWQGACGSAPEQDAEPDGDLDVALALVMAGTRWDPAYTAKAIPIIRALKAYTMTDSAGLIVQRPSDNPNFGGPTCLNPSYFAPAAYRIFASVVPADDLYWNKAARDAYVLLDRYQTKYSGLVPEWTTVDGDAPSCAEHNDTSFGQDAVRVPWRVALDYQWFGTPAAKKFLDKFNANHPGGSGDAAITHDGAAFWGAFAVAAMGGEDLAALDEYATTLLIKDDRRYYDDSLRALYLFTLSRMLLPTYH